jgi:hypothetical protein
VEEVYSSLSFEELYGIEEKYLTPGTKIDGADLIVIVLDVATKECQAVLPYTILRK